VWRSTDGSAVDVIEAPITTATGDECVFVVHRDAPFMPHTESNRNAACGSAKKATTVRASEDVHSMSARTQKRADVVHRRSISVIPSQVPLGKRSAVLVAHVAAGVPLIDRE
jgi:hypothetical protein